MQTTKQRLAKLRADAARHGIDWRAEAVAAAVVARFGPPIRPFSRQTDKPHLYWVEPRGTAGLRLVGYADEIVSLDHTGWWCDLRHQEETFRGVVYQLPARDGKELFAYGYADPYNGGAAFLDFSLDADTKEEAARWADGMAERYAEDEREYQEREAIDYRKAEIAGELKTIRADILALIREAKAGCDKLAGMTATKAAIRARVESLLSDRTDLFNERDKLDCEGWPAY